ncbi:DUF4232 domain-containing protein [Pimelobacter simplex]|uniref:DUF4232 domain-containing protein n=1 Tax=Nocardioides simplex TaxID=2045 RepID=UPI0037FF16B6
MRSTHRLALLAGLTFALALVVSACGTDEGGDATPQPGTSSAGSGTPGSGTSSERMSAGASESAAGPRACTAAQLSLLVRPAKGGGAAGSQYTEIVLTNSSDSPCTTGGFGGVSYVGGGDGSQIGAPARRVDAGHVLTLTLEPGEAAVQVLRETRAENYSRADCDPVAVDGLRVYPPNETHSLYAAHPTTGCASRSIELLEVEPYHAAA